jgi:hypothetical protein
MRNPAKHYDLTKLLLIAIIGFRAGQLQSQAKHNTILPEPQKIYYGAGRLNLQEARILLPANPAEEDKFSASTLKACIAKTTLLDLDIVVGETKVSKTSIFLHRTGALDSLPLPGETPGGESREAYSIHIDASGAEVDSRSSAGIFYGVQTLCQMVSNTDSPALPEATVVDWPSLAYRGTMVDMSEGPLLKVEEIKRQIDLLARWKMNQYYFYNETTIALDGLPPAAPGARLTKSDVEQIVSYARDRHIDVVPCLELYGHLHDLFRREEFSDLADFPHGVEFNVHDPRLEKLLKNWAGQYMDLFPSRFVHVGFDETWQLQQAARKGGGSPATEFVAQLDQVSKLFTEHGKTVLAWADIMVKYPEIVPHLPAGIIAVSWYYDPRPDPEYKHWLVPLVKDHIPHMVAPGVNGWSEIAPDYALTFDNIDTFLAAGRKSGALGMMNTIWSDDVQMMKRPAYPGIAYGAAAAWQQLPVNRQEFFQSYARIEYPPAAAANVCAALEEMKDSETALQSVLGQDTMSALWQSPFPSALHLQPSQALQQNKALRESRLMAERAEEHLLKAESEGVDPAAIQSYIVECRLLDYAGLKYQYGQEIVAAWKALGPNPDPDTLENDFDNIVVSQQHGKLPDLMEGITELKPQYAEAWQREYTTYRLAAALGRWDAEYEYWRKLQSNLQHELGVYDPKKGLPVFVSLLPADN